MGKIQNKLIGGLGHKNFPLAAALIALFLGLFTIQVGLQMDDYMQKYKFTHHQEGQESPILGAFNFMGGGEEAVTAMKNEGGLPWWTNSKLNIAFFRPISALSMGLDYTLWPENTVFMHLHSVLLFCLLAVMISLFYRRFMSVWWAAGLGVLLYIINDTFFIPVTWLANRNSLLALCFALPSIIFYTRQGESKGFLGLSLLFFLLSLLSAEAGLAGFAYIFAYTLFMDRRPVKERILSLLPFIVLILGWRLIYNYMGYGASGNEFYIDPGTDLPRFLTALFQRLPIMLLGNLNGLFISFNVFFSPQALSLLAIISVILFVLLAVLLKPLWRKNREAAFWFFGMVFAAVPACANLPGARNLIFSAIGGMALLAFFVKRVSEKKELLSRMRSISIKVLLAFLIFGRLSIGLLFFTGAESLTQMGRETVGKYSYFGYSEKELVIVNPPSATMFMHSYHERLLEGKPLPKLFRSLTSGKSPVTLLRTGSHSVVVKLEGGFVPAAESIIPRPGEELAGEEYMLNSGERLICTGKEVYAPGQQIPLSGLTVEILEVTEAQRPLEVAYHFDKPLEDESMLWLMWDHDQEQYVSFALPPVGGRVVLNERKG